MSRAILVIAMMVFSWHVALAGDAGGRAADEAAIRKAVRSYVVAFQHGDAKAVAQHWSARGVYVTPTGRRVEGREAIEKEFAAYFAESSGRQIEIGHPAIRFLTATVAVEEGTARVSRRGEPPTDTSYLAIHVRQGDVWKMDSVRETVVPPEPSHRDHLKQLEWMIGHWVDKGDDSTIDTVCEWTKNGNFITRSFAVSFKDRIDLEGTQVIGWDPVTQNIKSWMFDSEGGYGSGIWTRKGNRWIVKASRVLTSGEKASSVNIITYVDRNTFRWQSIGREIDGELLPNIDEVQVVRKQSPN